jgi:transglutaminase superfamily protein
MDKELLRFYTVPGEVTDLSKYADFVAWLTDDRRAIYQVVQGLLIHDRWLGSCGATMRPEQVYDTRIAYMTDLLDKALELDPRSLAIPRAPEQRVIGCCREFATLMCAILRQKGVPARSRCGFSTVYVAEQGSFEDHWICEVWHPEQQRWVRMDPQMDPLQQSILDTDADPLDLDETRFLTAGQAWKLCRSGKVQADRFGIGGDPKRYGLATLYGLWFVRGQLLRDFAALNKVETVPLLIRLEQHRDWSSWRLVGAADDDITEQDLALLDQVADIAAAATSLADITSLYTTYPDLQPPQEIMTRV